MTTYIVKVGINDPYPKEFTERVDGSSVQVAVSRTFRTLRKKDLKGKRLKEVIIKVIKL